MPPIEASDLARIYHSRTTLFSKETDTRAVNGVSPMGMSSETLDIVEESGSDKSTLGRCRQAR